MTQVRQLVSRKYVALDSNLLLLLTVGSSNPKAIRTQKRLSGFSVSDFELLRTFISQFDRVVTTAHVLTEVSNLAGVATGLTRASIFLKLASLISSLDERAMEAREVSQSVEFNLFGLTDAALASLSSQMLLLTEDGRLASYLQRRGHAVMSLQNIRGLRELSYGG